MNHCSVAGCERPQQARGWCLPHYKRWRRRGDVEDVTPERRFFSHVEQDGDCWVWQANTTNGGYGQTGVGGKKMLAHRWSYEALRAPIPSGLQLDHLCRRPACVNPWHLEPVSARENLMRGNTIVAANAAKTGCVNGHPFDAANTYVCPRGKRHCRVCRTAANQRRRVGATVGGRVS